MLSRKKKCNRSCTSPPYRPKYSRHSCAKMVNIYLTKGFVIKSKIYIVSICVLFWVIYCIFNSYCTAAETNLYRITLMKYCTEKKIMQTYFLRRLTREIDPMARNHKLLFDLSLVLLWKCQWFENRCYQCVVCCFFD